MGKALETVCVQRHVGVMRHQLSATQSLAGSCAAFYDANAPEQHAERPVTYCACGTYRVIWGDERD